MPTPLSSSGEVSLAWKGLWPQRRGGAFEVCVPRGHGWRFRVVSRARRRAAAASKERRAGLCCLRRLWPSPECQAGEVLSRKEPTRPHASSVSLRVLREASGCSGETVLLGDKGAELNTPRSRGSKGHAALDRCLRRRGISAFLGRPPGTASALLFASLNLLVDWLKWFANYFSGTCQAFCRMRG